MKRALVCSRPSPPASLSPPARSLFSQEKPRSWFTRIPTRIKAAKKAPASPAAPDLLVEISRRFKIKARYFLSANLENYPCRITWRSCIFQLRYLSQFFFLFLDREFQCTF